MKFGSRSETVQECSRVFLLKSPEKKDDIYVLKYVLFCLGMVLNLRFETAYYLWPSFNPCDLAYFFLNLSELAYLLVFPRFLAQNTSSTTLHSPSWKKLQPQITLRR